jgi:hypothetical protein
MMDNIEATVLKATLAMIRWDYEVQMNNSRQTNAADQHTCGTYA